MEGRKLAERVYVPAAAGIAVFLAIKLINLIPLGAIAGSAGAGLKRYIGSVPFKHQTTAALINALLTGDRTALSSDTVRMFRDSGASHLLALSGLHLGFIYSIIRQITSIMGNSPAVLKLRALFCVIFSIAYTLMTGASPSIVRAMFCIIINEACSLDAERERNGVHVLMLALLLQLAFTPSSIRSIGFQLSYLAVAGLHLVGIPMQNWFPSDKRFRLMKRIWNTIAVSIGCQLFTAPLAWHYFHTFPIHFLLTNMIAMPMTSILMALAVIVLTLHAINICPTFLLTSCDIVALALIKILGTISSM